MTDSITANITSGFEHEISSEIRRQGCQGIHSTYSVSTIASFAIIITLFDIFFNSGIGVVLWILWIL
jgi:hypothetical protein